MIHPGLHCASAREYFRYKNEGLPKLDPYDSHSRYETTIHDLEGIDPLRKRLFGQLVDFLVVPFDQGYSDFLEERVDLREQLNGAIAFFRNLEEFLDLRPNRFIFDLAYI